MPATHPSPTERRPNTFDQEDEKGFFAANKILLVIGVLVASGITWGICKIRGEGAPPPPKQEHLAMITLPPPPRPPPPPPPVQQPPPEQNKKMMDEAPKLDAPKPEPAKADEPPPSMGSNIKGTGNDGFGLSGSGNGGFVGFGGKGTGGGSAYGRYAAQVKARITDALKQNQKTRAAAFQVKVRLWIDPQGRVTRSEPVGSDSAGAAATLLGIQLADRPPEGMPMPLLASLAAHRP